MWSSLFQFILALPSLIGSVMSLMKRIREEKLAAKETARREAAHKAASDLKAAQEAGDVEAQNDALSRIVDDYNK